ncbi:MAG: hypothetical protein K1X55_10640 [Chitinophagales bacterium]|nr:hypothetical protein [Chitinophagales bacterium]
MWELIKDICAFLWERKLIWMIPLVIFMVLVFIILSTGSSSVVTPFVYSLF